MPYDSGIVNNALVWGAYRGRGRDKRNYA